MSGIGNIFAVIARGPDIRRAYALFAKNRSENTEMIDIIRSVATDAGVLDPEPTSSLPVPSFLRKYNTEWIQKGLNQLVGTQLRVDGDLGPPDSETRKAVKTYQAKRGLKVDGSPGVQTVALMEADLSQQGTVT